MAQVRAAALTNYLDVARFVGLDPYALMKRAKIAPAMLEDPDGRLPRTAVNFLLTESAAEANCISFGLMMAESRELSQLGAISLVLRHQETVRGVVTSMMRYQHLMGDTITVNLTDRDTDDVALVVGITEGAGTVERQGTELVMGVLYRAIAAVSAGRWRPKEVHFTHPAPGDPAVHVRVFGGAKLVFDSDFNGFVSSRAAMDAQYATTDADMARHAESYLDMLSPRATAASVSQQVRRALDLMLPIGRGTLDHVSENLSMTPRTLQRLLEKEGHSFGELLNAVRHELAEEHLSHSSRSIAEVAELIGYSTPSSFTRWFQSEFGVTPAAWRAGERPPETDPPEPSRSSRNLRSAA